MAFPTGWNYKTKLTQNHTKVNTANQTGFPLGLIWTGTIAGSNLPQAMFDADGGRAAKSAGEDIRFSTDAAGTTQVPFEIVTFAIDNDPANVRAEIWVKLPTLSYTADTTFYIWWGNSSATALPVTDTYGRNNVWTAFLQVWHMTGTSLTDATGGGITGTVEATGTTPGDSTACPFGTAKVFYGDASWGYFKLANMGTNIAQREMRVLALYDSDSNVNGHLVSSSGIGDSGGEARFHWKVNSDDASAPTINNERAAIPSDATHENASNLATSQPDVWQLLHFRYNKTNTIVYAGLNGTLATGKNTTNDTMYMNGVHIGHGRPTTTECNFKGRMDEVRISELIGDDWRVTEYNSLIDPLTFTTIDQDITIEGDIQARAIVSGYIQISGGFYISGDIQARVEISSTLNNAYNITGDIQTRVEISSALNDDYNIAGDIQARAEITSSLNNAYNIAGDIQARVSITSSLNNAYNISGDIEARAEISSALNNAYNIHGNIEARAEISSLDNLELPIAGDIQARAEITAGIVVNDVFFIDGDIQARAEISSVVVVDESGLFGVLANMANHCNFEKNSNDYTEAF